MAYKNMYGNMSEEVIRKIDFKKTEDFWRNIWSDLKELAKIQSLTYVEREALEVFFIKLESLFSSTSYFFEEDNKKKYLNKLEKIRNRLRLKTFQRITQAHKTDTLKQYKSATLKAYDREFDFLQVTLIRIFREMNEGLFSIIINIEEVKKETNNDGLYT